jgi:hypothetical protein
MKSKTFSKDEIQLIFNFSDEGYLTNIKFDVKDKEFFNPILDSRIMDKFCTQVFNNMNQLLLNIKQQKFNAVKIINKECSNSECSNTKLKVVSLCCDEKTIARERGIKTVLECEVCKQRIWITQQDEMIEPDTK